MKAVILSLLVVSCSVRAAATILGTTRSLNAYSSGYQYYDPDWNEYEHPPFTPWPRITILPDNRTDNSNPGPGASDLTISSAADYVGTGRATATANITPETMTIFLSSRAGHATGGSPPGPDIDSGAWNSSARASFDVNFSLDGFTLLHFSGDAVGLSTFDIWPGYLRLRDAGGATVYNPSFAFGWGGNFEYSVTLPAGAYSLETSTHVDPVNPQAGYNPLSGLTATLTLTPVIVPEPGSVMLLMAAAGMSARRRRTTPG